MTPVIHSIETRPGIAGESRILVTVEYDGVRHDVAFNGNTYGAPGPVVMLWGSAQEFVTEPGRFGERFNEDWVRRFYGANAWGTPTGLIDPLEFCPSCERSVTEGHYDNCQLTKPFPVGCAVEILAGGQWTGPYTVTDGEGRTPDHLVLRGTRGVFEHHNDAPFNLRRV